MRGDIGSEFEIKKHEYSFYMRSKIIIILMQILLMIIILLGGIFLSESNNEAIKRLETITETTLKSLDSDINSKLSDLDDKFSYANRSLEDIMTCIDIEDYKAKDPERFNRNPYKLDFESMVCRASNIEDYMAKDPTRFNRNPYKLDNDFESMVCRASNKVGKSLNFIGKIPNFRRNFSEWFVDFQNKYYFSFCSLPKEDSEILMPKGYTWESMDIFERDMLCSSYALAEINLIFGSNDRDIAYKMHDELIALAEHVFLNLIQGRKLAHNSTMELI